MKKILILTVASSALLWGCSQPSTETKDELAAMEAASQQQTDQPEVQVAATKNPFFAEWNTPFGIPPFDQIKDEHYQPAFDAAFVQLRAEVAAIADNKAVPDFENTYEAMERSGELLSKVSNVFGNITNTDTNDALLKLEGQIWPQVTREIDAIYLSPKIWAKVDAVYQERESLGLDAQQMRLVELVHRDFVRRGAGVDENGKNRLKEINAELSGLTTKFGQNLLAETKGFELVITDEADLAGLSKGMIGSAKRKAEKSGKPDAWVFGLNRSVFESFMTTADNRDLRKQMFDGYRLRASHGGDTDNGEVLKKIAALRAEVAAIKGYRDHASYQLETRMAKTPDKAVDFLLKVWKPGLARAEQEIADMQAFVDAEGGNFTIDGWDWWYYAEKVRKAKYNFDASQMKPYFQLDNVRDGAFYVAGKLFGVTFTEVKDAPKWNPAVQVFEVKAADGAFLGVFMVDYFARDSKRGGAWMSTYRDETKLDGEVRPLVTNNLNLTKPADGDPALMGFGEVTTLFHEFGHGLHGLLTQAKYGRFSGTSGPRDYTEFPAQMLEHWAAQPEVLAVYAKHYKTGEVIPTELVEKLQNASTFNQGFKTTEYIAASLLDMRWHILSQEEAEGIGDVREFEKAALDEYGLIPQIEPRYRSQYFAHIFAGGYSAGYYAYLWSEILDSDGFDGFEEKGDIFDPELSARLKTWVYEAGGSEEADVLYRKFRGQDPGIAPLLRNRGLAGGSN
jgi:peptidyl-dipeptidase Dcp